MNNFYQRLRLDTVKQISCMFNSLNKFDSGSECGQFASDFEMFLFREASRDETHLLASGLFLAWRYAKIGIRKWIALAACLWLKRIFDRSISCFNVYDLLTCHRWEALEANESSHSEAIVSSNIQRTGGQQTTLTINHNSSITVNYPISTDSPTLPFHLLSG